MNPVYLSEGFTHEECDRIVELESKLTIKESGIQRDIDRSGFRKSQHGWIHVPGNEWMYEKMESIIMTMNQEFFKFKIDIIYSFPLFVFCVNVIY